MSEFKVGDKLYRIAQRHADDGSFIFRIDAVTVRKINEDHIDYGPVARWIGTIYSSLLGNHWFISLDEAKKYVLKRIFEDMTCNDDALFLRHTLSFEERCKRVEDALNKEKINYWGDESR